jgi:replicative DNA helicase
MMGESKVLQNVYTPNDVADYTMEVLADRRDRRDYALRSGIGTLDLFMKPLLPGELTFLVANTGQGKTSLLQFWCRSVCKQLDKRPQINEVAVYATWETLVEESGLYDICWLSGLDGEKAWYGQTTDEEHQILGDAAMKRSYMPLWVIGRSLKRRRDESTMTLLDVQRSLWALENDQRIRPAIIFIDYVQIVDPEDWSDSKTIQVLKAAHRLVRMGQSLGCPIVAACQAKTEVLDRRFKVPDVYDGQWSSGLAQDGDRVIGIWYPSQTEGLDAYIPELGLRVTENLMVASIRKQRHARARQVFPLYFDPARNVFASWSDRDAEPEEMDVAEDPLDPQPDLPF